MIELKHLCKSYVQNGQTFYALRDVNLHIRAGEIFGVVGQSGAGKSTLIRCVNLLEQPSSGEVFVNGKNMLHLPHAELLRARHRIGMIFQHFNLLSSRTVYRNIALPLELAGLKKRAIARRIIPLLEFTGLRDKAYAYPAQLSGGQKQRVAIARALAAEPKVLLSDEATSALDPQTTTAILQLLQRINRELGLTILLITHEMDVVKQICDRVALLDHGELIESGSVEQFFIHPETDLARHFIAQSLHFDLPEDLLALLQEDANDRPVIQLIFDGENIQEPLISTLSRRFKINVNILQAKIERIKQTGLGILCAELSGESEAVAQALSYIQSLPIQLKVLGYVRTNS